MTVCLCQGGIRQLSIRCFICLGNSNRCVHPEVPTGTRTQPSWQAPLGNMHIEASFGHTAPSISINEGRRSGSAVHHRCVPNEVADGKWSLHLLHVLNFRVRVPGMEHQLCQGQRSRVYLLSSVKGGTTQRIASQGLSTPRHSPQASLRAKGLEVQCTTTLGDAQPSGSVPSQSWNDRMQSAASSVRSWLLLRVADTCGRWGGG